MAFDSGEKNANMRRGSKEHNGPVRFSFPSFFNYSNYFIPSPFDAYLIANPRVVHYQEPFDQGRVFIIQIPKELVTSGINIETQAFFEQKHPFFYRV